MTKRKQQAGGKGIKKLEGKAASVTGASRQKGIVAAICRELAKNGCNVFSTYWTDYDRSWMTEERKAKLQPKFPFGRVGEPQDASKLVTFLASDDAAWITGQILHSEGGFKRS